MQQLFDKIVNHLSAKIYKTELVSAIINLNSALKVIGEQIEALDKERMNRYQVRKTICLKVCLTEKLPQGFITTKSLIVHVLNLRAFSEKHVRVQS